MQQAKANILVCLFAYGGNGGVSSIIPEIAIWLSQAIIKLKNDPRVGDVHWEILSDTPITMTRNRAVRMAKDLGCDMVLMLDSDNHPDAYVGRDPEAKPFLDVAFPFAYDRLMQGLPTCIAAPYCGPPPNPCPPPGVTDNGEVPYLFQWSNTESHSEDCKFRIEMLSRREASRLRGIFPMAALPTGVSLFTLNCFEGMKHPHFYYEFNEDHSEKKSTEDVTCTRDISLFWMMSKGIEVVFAACDSWALHYKPKRVGKPQIITLEEIGAGMREAIVEQVSARDTVQYVDFTKGLPEGVKPEQIQMLKPKQSVADQWYDQHGLPNLQDRQHAPVDTTPKPVLDPTKLKRRWEHLRPEDDYIYVSDEEFAELERKAQLEAEQETILGNVSAIRSAVEQAFTDDDTDIDEPSDVDDGVSPVKDGPEKQNGHPLKYKMIGNRKVAVIDQEISDENIENLQALARYVVEKRDAPIEVAVVHAGTGQGTAAILPILPSGSHLYALDHVLPYKFNKEYANQFHKSFPSEEENGTVKASVSERKMPDPVHADLVFFERFVLPKKLEKWLPLVNPDGILAGLGYEDEEVKSVVDTFREKHGLAIQGCGDVWAIPVSVRVASE